MNMRGNDIWAIDRRSDLPGTLPFEKLETMDQEPIRHEVTPGCVATSRIANENANAASSRRLRDLALQLGCLGYFDDGPGPRAA